VDLNGNTDIIDKIGNGAYSIRKFFLLTGFYNIKDKPERIMEFVPKL